MQVSIKRDEIESIMRAIDGQSSCALPKGHCQRPLSLAWGRWRGVVGVDRLCWQFVSHLATVDRS